MTEQQVLDRGLRMLFLAEIVAAGISIITALGMLADVMLGMVSLVVLCLRIGGLGSLRRLRGEYAGAFLLVLIEIGVSFAASMGMLVALLNQSQGMLSAVLLLVSIISGVMGYLVVRSVCMGTQALLRTRQKDECIAQGDMARHLFLVVMVIVTVSNLLSLVKLSDRTNHFIGTLCNVLTAAAYLVYARFLQAGRKSLITMEGQKS